ncbi:MAG: TrkH family potassium uptake protein, partial [Candidatus Saccharibacteria bacterium]
MLRNEYKEFRPYQVITISFLVVMVLGGLLLSLPVASRGPEVSFVDGLFTATSALCVTGLVTVDPGSTFNLFGQLIILFWIQAGGLGVIVLSTLYALILGKKIGLKQRLMLKEAMNLPNVGGVVRVVQMALKYTLVIEGLGALALFLFSWGRTRAGLIDTAYYAVFHAVSAFCNAGFDLWGKYYEPFCSLGPLIHNQGYLITISLLIILGGLGFPVLHELVNNRNKKTLHTQVVIRVTFWLIIVGMAMILALEFNGVLKGLSWADKLANAFFLSVTPRTAGYTSVNFGAVSQAVLFMTLILMFIGASPLSTGGGIKTSTFAVLVATTRSRLEGKEQVEMLGRRMEPDIVYRAITVTMLYLT